ncbi:post-transcriptional regulator [Lacticigenium naphthae]|uniref:post-transcriptional regulator n=1 Tax=Lacticigenium naphthae TaxID=515351 RepID=UPI0004264B2B|nr:post-transcriptional regulator [Lacticigenium naphthae]
MSQPPLYSFSMYEYWIKYKVADFMKSGYTEIEPVDLWDFFIQFKWKRQIPAKYYSQVADIMSLEPNDYFNYESVKAQTTHVSLQEINLEGLL